MTLHRKVSYGVMSALAIGWAILATTAPVLFAGPAGAALAGSPAAADSGGYRGPLRNGVFADNGLPSRWPDGGPKLLWKFGKLGVGFGAPLVAADSVYVTGSRKQANGQMVGTVFCFGLNGELRWKQDYGPDQSRGGHPGPRATPGYSDGCVYVASGTADLHCLDACSGDRRWKMNIWADLGDGGGKDRLGWGYNESPLIAGDLVVVNACSTGEQGAPVVAVHRKTGKVVWKADPGEGNYSAGDNSLIHVEHGGRKMVIAHLVRALLALDLATGKTLWKLKPEGGHGMTPVYHDGILLVGYKSGLRALRLAADGKEPAVLWERPQLRQEEPARVAMPALVGYEPPIVLGRQVLCVKHRHTDITQAWWASLDLRSGEDRWGREVEGRGWPPPAPSACVADGMLYVFQNGPKCALARPLDHGFEIVSSFVPAVSARSAYAHPVVAQGKLLLRQQSLLAVYDLRGARPATLPAPAVKGKTP
jgi:outer membrane protein assembly factor BamB